MSLPRENPRIPEGINASEDNPLVEFAWLAATVLLSLAAVLLILSVAVKWLAPYIPFSWEQKVGVAVDLYLQSEEASTSVSTAAEAAIAELSGALLASSLSIPVGEKSAAEAVPAEAFRFHLTAADIPNAFATLGGNVMVTSGLLAKVESENGLAMVIAHEIAHVQLRHPIESLGRGVLLQIMLGAVLGTTDNSAVGGVLSSGGVLTLLSFSRDMELAADERALEILQAHYGHLGGADEFFRAINETAGDADWLEFVSTHPDTDRRIERIRAAMGEDGAVSTLREMPQALQVQFTGTACEANATEPESLLEPSVTCDQAVP